MTKQPILQQFNIELNKFLLKTKLLVQDCLQVTKIEDEDDENFELFHENRSLSKDENICILTITENEERKKRSSSSLQLSIKDLPKKPKNNQNCSMKSEENKGREKGKKKGKKEAEVEEESENSENEDEDEDDISLQDIRRQRNGKKIKKTCESCHQVKCHCHSSTCCIKDIVIHHKKYR